LVKKITNVSFLVVSIILAAVMPGILMSDSLIPAFAIHEHNATIITDGTIVNADFNTFPNLENLNNVTSVGCAAGEVLKVSGSSWICAADVGTANSITASSTDVLTNKSFDQDGTGNAITNLGSTTLKTDGEVISGQTDDATPVTLY